MGFQHDTGPKVTGKRNFILFLLPSEPNQTTKTSLSPDQEQVDLKKFKLDSPTEENIKLSLKPSHFGVPWKINTPQEKTDVVIDRIYQSIVQEKLKSFRVYTKQDKIMEGLWGVSTKLRLSEDTWKIKKLPEKTDMIIDTSKQSMVEAKLKSFRVYTTENKIEEERCGVSTKLWLSEDLWKIKKVLTASDTNGLSRLMISARLMRTEVLWRMDNDMVAKIESGGGARVDIWDYDHGCLYQLMLKRWEKNKCYVFNNNWTTMIVNRRGLRAGDEIGLFWDRINSRFGFHVLSWGGSKLRLCNG